MCKQAYENKLENSTEGITVFLCMILHEWWELELFISAHKNSIITTT